MIKAFDLTQLPAWGGAQSRGLIKQFVDDFRVDEISTTDFSESGEHLYLKVEKRLLTTEQCCHIFSQLTHLPLKQVSYAGLKDKLGVTTQWFSLHCPGRDLNALIPDEGEGWRIIERRRHHKKLKIGWLKGNRFQILIRDVEAAEALPAQLKAIAASGLPNYFGMQRFGHQGHNLQQAWQWFQGERKVKKPFLKGILLSSVRAFLFNQQLCQRVRHNCWNQVIAGDVVQLAGTKSVFVVDALTTDIEKRAAEHDISPCGELVGRPRIACEDKAKELRDLALSPFTDLSQGLLDKKLDSDWRSFVLRPDNFQWEWPAADQLLLRFNLPAGAYATTILSELFQPQHSPDRP